MNNNSKKKTNKKKWLVLGVVSTALLLIPQRSSRKSERPSKDLTAKNKVKNADGNII